MEKTGGVMTGHSTYRVEVKHGLVGLDDIVRSCRSTRIYDESDPISYDLMVTLVNLARRSASAANRQPLLYHVVSDKEEVDKVFEYTGWLHSEKGVEVPAEGSRPTGYIVILSSKELGASGFMDVGIAAQTICMGAAKAEFGGCMIKSIKPGLVDVLDVDNKDLQVQLVIALGKPGETYALEVGDPTQNNGIYRDEDGVLHVVKRPLTDVLV